MAEYLVTFSRSARKELERMDEPLLGRVFLKIERLAKNPRPTGCTKLEGSTNLWRVRIGDYRVVYSIDDNNRIVVISIISHRGDVYR